MFAYSRRRVCKRRWKSVERLSASAASWLSGLEKPEQNKYLINRRLKIRTKEY